jgi:hypothetical protein
MGEQNRMAGALATHAMKMEADRGWARARHLFRRADFF